MDNKKKDYKFFAMVSRMRYINRWELMRNTIEENIAEHSLDVSIIAHALGVINNVYFGGDVSPDKLAVVALFHDVPEVLTGDLPTPVKYYTEETRHAYAEVDKSAVSKLLRKLPSEMQDLYASYLDASYVDDYSKKLLKAADKISALIKCVEEKNMGNKDFIKAEKTTRDYVEKMNLKEANYFMEHFFGAYSLTIDEQSETESTFYSI